MKTTNFGKLLAGVAATGVVLAFSFAYAQQGPRGKTSYTPAEGVERLHLSGGGQKGPVSQRFVVIDLFRLPQVESS